MAIRIGYKASAEQFGPRELLDFSLEAERTGLDVVSVSDHFQPWRHEGGHAPNALVWLGALAATTERVVIGTSVLTPTLRYNPSIVAQAFGTLGALAPGRVFLGVGTGESLNETPATGGEFPGAKERRRRLAESVGLIERLWREERVDFDGEYYETRRATIYDRPEQPVPIYIAASGPLAAKLAGRKGEGFISTSGKDPDLYRELIANLAEGAEKADRDPAAIRKMIEIKVSYDRDAEAAFESCKLWSALGLSHEQKAGIDDPVEMERVADENADKAHHRFIVSSDPDEVIEKIMPYVELGFEDLILHAPGEDQRRFLDQFAADVLPALREEAGRRAGLAGEFAVGHAMRREVRTHLRSAPADMLDAFEPSARHRLGAGKDPYTRWMGKARSAAGARSALLMLGAALVVALVAGLSFDESDAGSRGLTIRPRLPLTVAAPGEAKSAKPRISLAVPAVGEAKGSIMATGIVAGPKPGEKVLLQRRTDGAWRTLARGVVSARRFRLSFLAPSTEPSLSVRAVLIKEGRQVAVSSVKSGSRVRAAAGGGSSRAPKSASPGSQSTGSMSPPSAQPNPTRPEGTPSPEPETEPQPQATPSSYWGAWIGSQLTGTEAPFDMNAVTGFEGLAEKPLSLINFSSAFANCPSSTSPSASCSFYSFPRHEMEAIRAYGAIPFFSWASDALPVTTSEPEFQFSDVIEGKFDSFISRFATEAREWGHPFFLRFNWEMNGNWFPWTERTNGNSLGQYVEAWEHVHDIFEEIGADNASWVWCPYVDPNATLQSLETLYPGDEYVDWTCLDGYNWGPSAEPPRNWRSFSYLFGPTYRQITGSIAPSKPMLIGETASSEIGGSKAEWIQQMFAALPTEFPKIQGLLWFDKEESGMDWPIETSESARNAFAAGIGEERFLGNSLASTSSDPIPAP